MGKFLTMSYWLNMRPGDLHFTGTIFFAALIIVFIIIIVLFRIAKKRKNNIYYKIWRNLNSFAVTNLILGLFLWFFEYEGVYIFSSRLWLIFWVLSMLIWAGFILKSFKKIPEIKKEHEKKKEYQKYIP